MKLASVTVQPSKKKPQMASWTKMSGEDSLLQKEGGGEVGGPDPNVCCDKEGDVAGITVSEGALRWRSGHSPLRQDYH
jgi:hypothetical protein